MSSRSITTSTIQSHSATLPRSSSRLPTVTSLAARSDMNAAGSVFNILATAPAATAFRSFASFGTMSSSRTGTPALATCAAMPAPITPEPRTATFLM